MVTVKIHTKSPWYKTKTEFEGVPVKRLLAAVGASGESLTMTALNDYVVEMPVEDTRHYNVIVALKRDGAYMPISDKGPLFVIYDFDSDSQLRQKKFYGRSAWQLAKIEVR